MCCLTSTYLTALEAEKKVQKAIYLGRIRILESFKTYDPLNHKVITLQQFIRGLDQCGIALMQNEIEALHRIYVDTKDGGIRYVAFAEKINNALSGNEYEKGSKKASEVERTILNRNCLGRKRLLGVEMSDNILNKLTLLCATRAIVFKDCFQNFDPLRRGLVSETQFMRQFPFKIADGNFSHEEIKLLMKSYSEGNGDVNYRCIHNHVSQKKETSNLPVTSSVAITRRHECRYELQDLEPERIIQALVARNRLQLCEAFQDLDKLHQGCCKSDQARSTLNNKLGISLNEQEWSKLKRSYCRKDGSFDYINFCKEVNSIFTDNHLEKCPLQRIKKIDRRIYDAAQRNRIILDSKQQIEICEIEDSIASQIRRSCMNCKTAFQDFDRLNTQHVTKNQFSRIMCILGLQQTKDVVEKLSQKYCDMNVYGKKDLFNYIDFLKNVDDVKVR